MLWMKASYWRSLLGALVLLAACGGGVDVPAELPAGYYVADGDGVALALPPGWVAIRPTVQDFRAVADHVRPGNPFLAQRVEKMGEAIETDTLRFAAYHEDGITSVNIAAQGVTPLENLEAHVNANRRGLQELGYQMLDQSTIALNGRRYARTEAVIELFGSNTRQILLVQYTILSGGTAYSISFGTTPYRFAEFEAEFDQIAGTFHTIDRE